MSNFIIKNGTIIDVENGGTYVGSIEIEQNTVKRIFKSLDELPEGVETIDAEGKYIIPGLIDMHCHINERFAPHFVASGVTTIRNTAGNVFLLKNLIEKPVDAPTPRIYASDRMIDGTPGQWGPTSFGNLVTDDPELARKEVRRQAEIGAKFVKLYGWIKRDVMAAAVDEAKKYNLEVSIDSEVTGMSTGHPVRCIRNKMTRQYLELERNGADFMELEKLTLGSLRNAVIEGDVVTGTVMAGQIAGLIKEEKSCKEIVEEIMSQAEAVVNAVAKRF